jgi:two-component system invasion response regulator UvrY
MTDKASKIGVMIVDDHDLVRRGFASLLSSQEGIEVVAEANSGEAAIEHCRNNGKKIDVILMDVNMPGIGGMEATQRISTQWPDIGIIIITVHADGPLPRRLLKGGAKGYLTKGNDVTEMVEAIRDVHSGGRYIAKDIAQQLALSMLPGQDSIIDSLSKRELQILMMIAQAHKNNEIAETLNLSPKTVSTYRKRLHEKLDVSNDIEMLHLAMKHGILDDDLSGGQQ